MKVAYVFTSPHAASFKLGQMILPQLEAGTHGVEVVGMFFFEDNVFVLRQGDPVGERLARVAQSRGMMLMMCTPCALDRGLAEWQSRQSDTDGQGRKVLVECCVKDAVVGTQVGCFPDLYKALAGNPPDQVISL